MLSLRAGPARLNTVAINADGFCMKGIVRQYESFKVEDILTTFSQSTSTFKVQNGEFFALQKCFIAAKSLRNNN